MNTNQIELAVKMFLSNGGNITKLPEEPRIFTSFDALVSKSSNAFSLDHGDYGVSEVESIDYGLSESFSSEEIV